MTSYYFWYKRDSGWPSQNVCVVPVTELHMYVAQWTVLTELTHVRVSEDDVTSAPATVASALHHALDAGVDVNANDAALFRVAVFLGAPADLLDRMWTMSADVLNVKSMNPLCVAVEGQHVHTVRWLIAHGVDLDARDECSASALYYAACHCDSVTPGAQEILEILLAAGTDVNADGKNALAGALLNRDAGNLRRLARAGADLLRVTQCPWIYPKKQNPVPPGATPNERLFVALANNDLSAVHACVRDGAQLAELEGNPWADDRDDDEVYFSVTNPAGLRAIAA